MLGLKKAIKKNRKTDAFLSFSVFKEIKKHVGMPTCFKIVIFVFKEVFF